MRAAADYMMGRYHDAHNDIAASAFDNDRHAAFWRGLTEAALENWGDARKAFDSRGLRDPPLSRRLAGARADRRGESLDCHRRHRRRGRGAFETAARSRQDARAGSRTDARRALCARIPLPRRGSLVRRRAEQRRRKAGVARDLRRRRSGAFRRRDLAGCRDPGSGQAALSLARRRAGIENTAQAGRPLFHRATLARGTSGAARGFDEFPQ